MAIVVNVLLLRSSIAPVFLRLIVLFGAAAAAAAGERSNDFHSLSSSLVVFHASFVAFAAVDDGFRPSPSDYLAPIVKTFNI